LTAPKALARTPFERAMQIEDDQFCARCGGMLREIEGFPECPNCATEGGASTEFFNSDRESFSRKMANFPSQSQDKIGDYEILGEIARGGMGMVYKARQARLNRIVALKVMLPGIIANRAQVQRFKAEAQIEAGLNHPNIISVHEVGEDGGVYYFSMPFVQGADLSKKGRVSSKAAARYVEKIAQAVYHAHQRGVLHRDLKPNNVLVDEQDEPRIVDFGIAKLTAENQMLTQTGESLGTPSYMAPEKVHPDGNGISVATDIYALGGILYFLLTGRPPFPGGSRDQILWAVFYDEPARPSQIDPSVPKDLETICLKCLSKDPAQRYATAGEMAEDLRRYSNHKPISARPVSIAQRAIMWAKRNPALAVSVSALIAALIYGAIAQELALRQAKKARADAEGLIEFMDRELTEKLRPLGKLDLTADVIRRIEAYFKNHDEANSGPEFLMHKASFFFRSGELCVDLGKTSEAEQMALEGLAALDRFLARRGSDAEGWSLRASLGFLLFTVMGNAGKGAQSSEYGARALEDQRRALEIVPNSSKKTSRLCEILTEVGTFHRRNGNREKGEAFLNEATERLNALLRDEPNDLKIQNLLANTHRHKGWSYLEAEPKDKDAALHEFKLFIEGMEAVAHQAPSNREWQYQLSVAYGWTAGAYHELRAYEECEVLIEKWRIAAEELAAYDPRNVLWRASLAQSFAWAGLVIRDQVELDPRVPERFGRALEMYHHLSIQDPDTDQHVESIEHISANMVRYYERLREEKGTKETERRARGWLRQLQARFPETAPPNLSHWTEARAHALLGNLVTRLRDYDQSVIEWRRSLDLLKGLIEKRAANQLREDMAYAYKSLVSVQGKGKRADLAALLSIASEALDWVEAPPAKSANLVADLCLFISTKALDLDDGATEINQLLSRCRLLIETPAAREEFEMKVQDRAAVAN
jgi:tRNA A-37 threonylcarbamoyl transferase component Bud32/tetratricopeptide (TPR) repeat protein